MHDDHNHKCGARAQHVARERRICEVRREAHPYLSLLSCNPVELTREKGATWWTRVRVRCRESVTSESVMIRAERLRQW